MGKRLTTRAGLRRLQSRVLEAEAAYAAVVASNPEANEAGDSSVWHDNFAYEENQRLMHQWARRVRDLREILVDLEVVEPSAMPQSVGVGCVVEVSDVGTERRHRYCIVGWDDGDLRLGRLAYNSPLGLGLLGAAIGEVRQIRTGGGEREVEVLTIARDVEVPA